MKFWDSVVFLAYLAVLAVMVWRLRRTSKRPEEFFLAGRRFGAIAIGISAMVTTFSAVNFIAFPGEVYGYGLYVLASLPVFFLAAWPVVRWWLPRLLAQKEVSIYAFLEKRFDHRTRLLTDWLFLIWRLSWMGAALYASCRIMSEVTGFDFMWLVLLSSLAAAGYSAIGGMRAVVWTDVLQFVVLFGSIALGVILAVSHADWQGLSASGNLRPFYPADWRYLLPDPGMRISLWSALIGTMVVFMTRFGADQMVMQRFLSARNLKSAQRGLWMNGVFATSALSLLTVFGLAVALYAGKAGLPAGTPPVKAISTLLRGFPAGATGLLAAGLLAATMSSIDSGLNSCAAVVCSDLSGRFGTSRLLTWLLTLPVLLAALWLFPWLNRTRTMFVILNKLINTIGTPLLAVMICALFLPKTRANAVFYGTVVGMLLTVAAGFFLRNLALHGYAPLSLIMTMTSIFVCSKCLKSRQKLEKHP